MVRGFFLGNKRNYVIFEGSFRNCSENEDVNMGIFFLSLQKFGSRGEEKYIPSQIFKNFRNVIRYRIMKSFV